MKKYIYITLSFIVAVSFLTSCLKDDSLVLDPEKGHNVIEFANPVQIEQTGTPFALYGFSFEAVASFDLPITVSYSGPEASAPEDITVKVRVGDASAITAYNTATGSTYEKLNAAGTDFTETDVIIKKGTSKGTFNVVVKPNSFDFSKTEVLPLTIVSASSGIISGNFGTILLRVSAKNKYDGLYEVTGTMVDVTAPLLTHVNTALGADAPMQFQLVTVSATKVALYDDYVTGGYNSPISNGTAFSQYGSFSAIFEFDPATNRVIAVTNRYGQPAANTRSARLDPTGENTPWTADGSFKVKYNMLQPSVVTAAPFVRTTWDETWKKLGPRP
jgi:hypothetical protein